MAEKETRLLLVHGLPPCLSLPPAFPGAQQRTPFFPALPSLCAAGASR